MRSLREQRAGAPLRNCAQKAVDSKFALVRTRELVRPGDWDEDETIVHECGGEGHRDENGDLWCPCQLDALEAAEWLRRDEHDHDAGNYRPERPQ